MRRAFNHQNFAHMEMRLILVHLIHHFHFKLAPPTSNYDRTTYLGINRGTMGPKDTTTAPGLRRDGVAVPALGLHLHAVPRQKSS